MTSASAASPSRARRRSATSAGSTDRKSTRLNSKSPVHLVCRLLLEKKKQKNNYKNKRRRHSQPLSRPGSRHPHSTNGSTIASRGHAHSRLAHVCSGCVPIHHYCAH